MKLGVQLSSFDLGAFWSIFKMEKLCSLENQKMFFKLALGEY